MQNEYIYKRRREEEEEKKKREKKKEKRREEKRREEEKSIYASKYIRNFEYEKTKKNKGWQPPALIF